MDKRLLNAEEEILKQMVGKFSEIVDGDRRSDIIKAIAKKHYPDISHSEINAIIEDMSDFAPIAELLADEDIEDIMINNTTNIFAFSSKRGSMKIESKIDDRDHLNRFVAKLKLYLTNSKYSGNIVDIHLPNGSRANVVSSPLGYNISIRNQKKTPLSILDLINTNVMDYEIAARLWLYVDGLKVRPANLLIGGVPAAGKTTLLNAMFSFFRPDQRIITIEETYELNTSTQENCVNLETSEDIPMEALVKNALRMRPDLIIIGEVRGAEANDMITAMNIGKIAMGTIHGSSSRDIVNRLQHTPMNVPMDIVPVIDALVVVSPFYNADTSYRKVTQISEISGIETQVLLSDLYKYDYKTRRGSPILPSVTYRDMLANLLGVPPTEILAEERVRAIILETLNKQGKRSISHISDLVKKYYDNPDSALKSLGVTGVQPAVRV
ncbi:MAG: CpaF family protein [Candidatus Micrarchaeota archaeon]|nr:CpaF family protein [Candidatus Micrarchaeota archaeon]